MKMVSYNNITIWTESFGHREDPAVLLIAGSGLQAIMWPTDFCQQLANQGFFVIRYDYRDTGKSTSIDYSKSPYTIMDMTEEAVKILESYEIKQAHLLGFSMGGQIAQFMAAYFPDYVASLILFGTSTDFEPGFNAFVGKHEPNRLSSPKEHYVKWVNRTPHKDPTHQDNIADFMQSWKFLNGSQIPLDEALYLQLAEENLKRAPLHDSSMNHALAMQASFADHRRAPSLINAPTMIILGDEDPIFGLDHAEALKNSIRGAKAIIAKGLGHCLNPPFYSLLIDAVKNNANKSS